MKIQITKIPGKYQDGGPLHAGTQDWANAGFPTMQDGGNPDTSTYYTRVANQLELDTQAKLAKDKADELARIAEEKYKISYDKNTSTLKNTIATSDKYLKDLYKKYEGAQYNRANHGFEPFFGSEKPEDFKKQIDQLEKTRNQAVEKLKMFIGAKNTVDNIKYAFPENTPNTQNTPNTLSDTTQTIYMELTPEQEKALTEFRKSKKK